MLQEGRRTEIQVWFTHSRVNLALTLTKHVLRTKDLISMLLDGLEVFLDMCVMYWDSSCNIPKSAEINHALKLFQKFFVVKLEPFSRPISRSFEGPDPDI